MNPPPPLVTGNSNSPYVISDGVEGDLVAWEELYNYINTANLSIDANFNTVAAQLDTDGFIDYIISQTFIHNNDWPGNNIKIWRNKNADDPSGFDTKWRFLPMDMDHGFGYANCNTYSSNNFSTVYNNTNTICSTIFTRLMQNAGFKKQFINRYCELLDTVLSSSVISPIWEDMVAQIQPVMQEHFNRWPVNNTHTYTTWTNTVSVVRTYASKRADKVYSQLVSTFGSSNVPAQTYLSNLDAPTAGARITADTMTIGGWAVSVSETDGFYYIIDDNEPIAMTGGPGSDITTAYGNSYDTSKAVFSASADISALEYGTHTLTVYCKIPSGTDRVVGSSVTFTKAEPSEDFYCNLDYPKNNQTVSGGTLLIRGWAVHGGTTDYFTYVLDDGEEIRIEGYDREDITSLYGASYNTSRSGFNYDIDVSALPEGNHTIAVYTYSQTGKRNLVEEIRTVYVSAATDTTTVSKMESPTNGASVSGTLTIKGYALNPSGISGFVYSIDGGKETSVAGIRRSELRLEYGMQYGNSVFRSCGLSASVDISTLTPGTHILRAWYILTTGERWLVGGSPITFTIPVGEHLYYVDYHYTNSHTAYIRGWATTKTVPFLRIDAVSVAGTVTLDREEREAVREHFPGYAVGNEGFRGFIDFSHVAPGSYSYDLRGYYSANDYILLGTYNFDRQEAPSIVYNVEAPAENTVITGSSFSLFGWALHAEGIRELYYSIGANEKKPFFLGSRPDLDTDSMSYYVYALHNNNFENVGFVADIDLTEYYNANPRAPITIRITGISHKGTEFTLLERKYDVNADFAKSIAVSSESLQNATLDISGWFVHQSGVSAMHVQIDDREPIALETSYFDLLSANVVYQSFAAANDNFANTGFNLKTSLRGISNGAHTLTFTALLKTGEAFTFHKENFTKNIVYNLTVNATEGVSFPCDTTITDEADFPVNPTALDGYIIDAVTVTIAGSAYTLPATGNIPYADIIGDVVITINAHKIELNIVPRISTLNVTQEGTTIDMHLYTDRETVEAFTLFTALYDADGRMIGIQKTKADPIAKTPFTLSFAGITTASEARFFYLSDTTLLSPISPMSTNELN